MKPDRAKQPRIWPLRLTYTALAVTVLLLVGAPLAIHWHAIWSAERNFAAAIAETDQLDPDWRSQKLEAKRRVVRDEENSALVVLAAAKRMGVQEPWPHAISLPDGTELFVASEIEDASHSPQRFRDAVFKYMGKQCVRFREALDLARRLKDLPLGHYPVSISLGPLGAQLRLEPHLSAADQVRWVLTCDAYVSAEAGDVAGAVDACGAILNLGRSFGDEPTVASQLRRMDHVLHSVRVLEQILSWRELSEAQLAQWQAELTAERTAVPPHELLRYLRAQEHEVLLISDIDKHPDQQDYFFSFRTEQRDDEEDDAYKRRQELQDFFYPPRAHVLNNHAHWLRHSNKYVAAEKLPAEEQQARLLELMTEEDGWWWQMPLEERRDTAWRFLGITFQQKVMKAVIRRHTLLDCARTALAAERFRLQHGRWPQQLQQLVPEYFDRVPVDPYCKQPLRTAPTHESLTVYSVGPNGQDDGGELERSPPSSGPPRDLGFRIWKPAHRHMLPLPPEEESLRAGSR
jgi:hypothetical protein